MALKGTMEVLEERIGYIAQTTSNPGYLWVLQTGVSKWSDDLSKCTIVATPTNVLNYRVLGVNKWKVQDIGFSYDGTYDTVGLNSPRDGVTLRNDWRGAQVKNQPITLISKGSIITDAVTLHATKPLAGDPCYLGSNGTFCDALTASSLYGVHDTAALVKTKLEPWKVGYFESVSTFDSTSTTFCRIRIDV